MTPARVAPLLLLLIFLSLDSPAQTSNAPIPPNASAQEGGPLWRELSSAQRKALKPLQRDWDRMDPARKDKWLELAGRFHTLNPADQARVQERMSEWVRLSPAARQQARIGYQGAQQYKAEDRLAKWEAYQALPPEKREELAAKAASKRGSKPVPPRPAEISGIKSNLVPQRTLAPAPQPVAPSLLQAKPGATTVLITQGTSQPAHQWAGKTKVIADPSLVDAKTLLPLRSPAASAPQQ